MLPVEPWRAAALHLCNAIVQVLAYFAITKWQFTIIFAIFIN